MCLVQMLEKSVRSQATRQVICTGQDWVEAGWEVRLLGRGAGWTLIRSGTSVVIVKVYLHIISKFESIIKKKKRKKKKILLNF